MATQFKNRRILGPSLAVLMMVQGAPVLAQTAPLVANIAQTDAASGDIRGALCGLRDAGGG